jgi:hypothetical protein
LPNNKQIGLEENKFYHLQIVGIYYTKNGRYLSQLPPKTQLELRAEPNNKYDRFAVSVWHNNKKLGYLPRHKDEPFFNALLENATLNCLLGCYIPSSHNKYSTKKFQPERAKVTIHTYRDVIEWRPISLVPEDSMAF